MADENFLANVRAAGPSDHPVLTVRIGNADEIGSMIAVATLPTASAQYRNLFVRRTTDNTVWRLNAAEDGWVAGDAPTSGDVAGPAGAVASNLVAFDGATGKILQDAGVSAASFDAAGSAAAAEAAAKAASDPAGSAAGVQGNLTAHTGLTTAAHGGLIASAEKGAANGVASLDASGKLASGQIPAIAIKEFLGVAASQAAMLLLTGEKGDWCVRSDDEKTYIIIDGSGSQVADWQVVYTPAAPVLSVNGKTGAVVLGHGDVGAPPYHGFVDRSATLAMSGANLQITTGSSYKFWINGVEFTKSTTQQVEITEDKAETYVYFDSAGVLQKSLSAWSITDLTVIPVAVVFKDGSDYLVWDERHSYLRASLHWHLWAHRTIGARYVSGLAGTFDGTTLSVTQGVFLDEDLSFDSGGTLTSATLWYRDTGAAAMRFEAAQAYPYKQIAGVLQYDDNGTLTPVATTAGGRYVASYIYATPGAGTDAKLAVVVGQRQHASINGARSDAAPVFPAGITTLEWKLLYRVIYRNVSGTATYVEAQDFRNVQSGPAATFMPTDHATLTNRDAANAHPATAISNEPAGNIAATTVQAALDELDDEKAVKGSVTTSGLTQNTSRILGRTTASAGAVEEISVGAGLELSGGSLVATGSGGVDPVEFAASENLAAGDFVNLWNDSGTMKARKADGSAIAKSADGFVLAAVTSGNTAEVYMLGTAVNDKLSSLTAGTRYYLSDATAGAVTATAPGDAGDVVQFLGKALSATTMFPVYVEPAEIEA